MTQQTRENTDFVRAIIRPERQLSDMMDELHEASGAFPNSMVPDAWKAVGDGRPDWQWLHYWSRMVNLIDEIGNSLSSDYRDPVDRHRATVLLNNSKEIVGRIHMLTGTAFQTEYGSRGLFFLGSMYPGESMSESPLSEFGWDEILEDLSTLKETIYTSTIPDNFKNDLLNTLTGLENTIYNHQFNGTDPIQNNVDRGIGIITRLLLLGRKVSEDDANIVKRCWSILGQIHTAVYRDPNVLPPGIEIMNQIGSGL